MGDTLINSIKRNRFAFRFMKNGDLFLENSLVNIDGDSEIGDKSLKCHTIFLKGVKNISWKKNIFIPLHRL